MDVGHATIASPPFAPHPVTALVSVVGVMANVEDVDTPVIVAVAGEVQVFALMVPVPTVMVVFVIPLDGRQLAPEEFLHANCPVFVSMPNQ